MCFVTNFWRVIKDDKRSIHVPCTKAMKQNQDPMNIIFCDVFALVYCKVSLDDFSHIKSLTNDGR